MQTGRRPPQAWEQGRFDRRRRLDLSLSAGNLDGAGRGSNPRRSRAAGGEWNGAERRRSDSGRFGRIDQFGGSKEKIVLSRMEGRRTHELTEDGCGSNRPRRGGTHMYGFNLSMRAVQVSIPGRMAYTVDP